MQTKIRAEGRASGAETDLVSSQHGDLNVSQFLPPYAQLSAKGAIYAFDMSGGTAKTCVEAMPTTSPEWGIYNGETSKYVVLLQVGVLSQSGTMGLGLAVVCTSAIGAQTAVTANYTSSVVSCLDGSAKVPNAYLTNNPTLVGGTPAWVAFDAINQTSAIAVGTGVIAHVGGMIIAPPRGLIGIEVLGLTGTTALFDVNVVVAILDLDIG